MGASVWPIKVPVTGLPAKVTLVYAVAELAAIPQ